MKEIRAKEYAKQSGLSLYTFNKYCRLGSLSCRKFNKGLKAAQSGDFKTVLAEWIPLAEQGNARAQYNLGRMYANGIGVLENDKTDSIFRSSH